MFKKLLMAQLVSIISFTMMIMFAENAKASDDVNAFYPTKLWKDNNGLHLL